jgi:predicted alpha/beta hydrolase family esterase
MAILMLPGCGGSGEKHWQTIWERSLDAASRFEPSSWTKPNLEDWIGALDRAVAMAPRPPVLVAHSLACLLVGHWSASASRSPVSGAFLVSVPDPRLSAFPEVARSFGNVPEQRLRFPSLVVSSGNDPFGSAAYSKAMSDVWGAGFIRVGDLGHINAASGHGEWPKGQKLLEAFIAGLSNAPFNRVS